MKKIKLFFVRNYQRFIRFLISLSAVSALVVAMSFSASAAESYYFFFSQPQVTDTSCYFEIVRSDGYCCVVYGFAGATPREFIATLSNGRIYFDAEGIDEAYKGFYLLDRWTGGSLLPRNNGLYYFDLAGFGVGAIYAHNAYCKGFSAPTTDRVFLYGQDLQVNDNFTTVISLLNQLKSSGATAAQIQQVITSIGNLDNHTNGNLKLILEAIKNQTTTQNAKLDEILQAIKDNKSSAEKEQYSGATDEQKKAQSDLDAADKKITEDTAEARASTINLFKNFTLPGDIMKGLLCVTNIFNSLCAGLPFAPIVLNFSLAVGAAAFLLGLTAVFVRFGRSRK
mgnify:CR=1 FL=1